MSQGVPSMTDYARAAARECTRALQPMQDMVVRWHREGEAAREAGNANRASYFDTWAQRAAQFTVATATR